jgi:6-phosphogluconolactonase
VSLRVACCLLAWASITGCGDDDGAADAATRDAPAPLDANQDGGEAVDAALPDAPSDVGTPDAGEPARVRRMIVSVGGQERLAVVDLGADGSMSARTEFDLVLPNRPGAMVHARAQNRIYVGVGNSIGTVSLDGMGVPSLVGLTPDTGNPVYLEVLGEQLVTAYFGDNRLRVHNVGGAPPHAQTDTADTDVEPHAATRYSDTQFYVPHRNGESVQVWSLDGEGTLTAGARTAGTGGTGPRHIAFHPNGELAYLIEEYTDRIGAYRIEDDGSLSLIGRASTLPDGVDGDSNTCADVHITPDGQFVYGTNRGHDSIAMFRVEPDGSLASLGTVSTEARPREMDLSPDGRFVVAAGQDSGALQSYRIEPDGTLTSIERLDVGPGLRWVLID